MRLSIFILLTIVGVGCTEPFQPKLPYEQRTIVASILSTSGNKALARVYTTYNPPGFDPFAQTSDTPVRGAQVTLSTIGTTIGLRDTVLTRADKSRFSTDIDAYVHTPLRPQYGRSYTLSVQIPGLDRITSTVTVPGVPFMLFINPVVLDDPTNFIESYAAIRTDMAPEAFGSMVRAFLEYERTRGADTLIMREEVPSLVYLSGNLLYPEISRRANFSAAYFPVLGFKTAQSRIYASNPPGSITIKRAVFVLTQVEYNLYAYYTTVHGFLDPSSIRLDQPDFTNIVNGVGVFGAYTENTLVYDLKPGIW